MVGHADMSDADSGAATTAIPGFTYRTCIGTCGEVYRVIQNRVSTFRNVTNFDGRSVAAAASWQTLLICFVGKGRPESGTLNRQDRNPLLQLTVELLVSRGTKQNFALQFSMTCMCSA
jgi:hypothetical protein